MEDLFEGIKTLERRFCLGQIWLLKPVLLF